MCGVGIAHTTHLLFLSRAWFFFSAVNIELAGSMLEDIKT